MLGVCGPCGPPRPLPLVRRGRSLPARLAGPHQPRSVRRVREALRCAYGAAGPEREQRLRSRVKELAGAGLAEWPPADRPHMPVTMIALRSPPPAEGDEVLALDGRPPSPPSANRPGARARTPRRAAGTSWGARHRGCATTRGPRFGPAAGSGHQPGARRPARPAGGVPAVASPPAPRPSRRRHFGPWAATLAAASPSRAHLNAFPHPLQRCSSSRPDPILPACRRPLWPRATVCRVPPGTRTPKGGR